MNKWKMYPLVCFVIGQLRVVEIEILNITWRSVFKEVILMSVAVMSIRIQIGFYWDDLEAYGD